MGLMEADRGSHQVLLSIPTELAPIPRRLDTGSACCRELPMAPIMPLNQPLSLLLLPCSLMSAAIPSRSEKTHGAISTRKAMLVPQLFFSLRVRNSFALFELFHALADCSDTFKPATDPTQPSGRRSGRTRRRRLPVECFGKI